MPRICPILSLLAVLAFCSIGSVAPALGGRARADSLSAADVLAGEESGLATAINQQRAVASLPALSVDETLTGIARERSQDQVNRHYFSHTTPDGTTVVDLLNGDNIPWTSAGENLEWVRGKPPVQTTIADFMASREHRDNVLNSAFGRFGVGVAQAGDGSMILAVVFTN